MVLRNVRPPYPPVLTFTVIFPSPPGGICLVKETAAHPHPVSILFMIRGPVPWFCTAKSCLISVPSTTGAKVYRSSGKKAFAVCCFPVSTPSTTLVVTNKQHATIKIMIDLRIIETPLYKLMDIMCLYYINTMYTFHNGTRHSSI